MMVKIALSLVFVGLLALGLVQRKAARRIGLLIIALSTVALLAIWNDAAVTRLANAAGVGRGTDLVLYLWIPLSLAFGLLLYLRINALERMITQLARHHAIHHPIHQPSDVRDP